MDLSVAMIRARHDLKDKIAEIRSAVNLPPYILCAILTELQNELKDEEKELLTVMLVQATEQPPEEEHEDEKPTAEVGLIDTIMGESEDGNNDSE